MDDETYRKARIKAAEAGTSVSAMVREFLNRDEDAEAVREASRIEALESWYAIFDKQAQDNLGDLNDVAPSRAD